MQVASMTTWECKKCVCKATKYIMNTSLIESRLHYLYQNNLESYVVLHGEMIFISHIHFSCHGFYKRIWGESCFHLLKLQWGCAKNKFYVSQKL